MRILCATDTSDDGYEALGVVARTIDRNAVDEIRLLVVTWPVRASKIWERAQGLWLAEHDLHSAMAVAAERELDRFKNMLNEHAKRVVAIQDAGEPISIVLEHAASMNADLIFLVITRDPAATAVAKAASRVIARSPVPVVVVHGGPSTEQQHASLQQA